MNFPKTFIEVPVDDLNDVNLILFFPVTYFIKKIIFIYGLISQNIANLFYYLARLRVMCYALGHVKIHGQERSAGHHKP